MYLFSSLLCSIRTKSVIQPLYGEAPSYLVRWTWGLYSTIAPLEIMITILYWSAEFNGGDVAYIIVMEHGIICLFVLFDGLIVGLVPIRLKHFRYLLTICITYLLWSIVDTYAGIGNGEWGPAYDDEALYSALRWESETKTAAILSAFVIFLVTPIVFVLCWAASLLSSDMKKFDGSRRPIFDGAGANIDGTKECEAFDYIDIEN